MARSRERARGLRRADQGDGSRPRRRGFGDAPGALFETTRLYVFAGGNLPDGTEVKGCRMLVLPDLDNYMDFRDRGECVETENTHCEPPRREVKTKWGFSKSVPYQDGGWTTAENTVARSCGTICNENSPTVLAVHKEEGLINLCGSVRGDDGRAGQGTGHVHEKR